ncbi:MAG TPA: hypothetical protein PLD42_08630, partial [Gemmiger formicilis]|nr:hypothetical protein [Gemmiger formicilis]
EGNRRVAPIRSYADGLNEQLPIRRRVDKPVGGLPSNDGVGRHPVYINGDRLVTFAKMVGGIDDENILEMLRTAKGFRKLVHSVGVSIVGVVALALLGGCADGPGEPSP